MICIIIENNKGEKYSIIVEAKNRYNVLKEIHYNRVVAEYKINAFIIDKNLQ